MEYFIYLLAYIGYMSLSSLLAYPMLKAKSQLPAGGIPDMVLFNICTLGLLPFIASLMKYPPKNPNLAESYDYYQNGKIWKWNK